MYYIKGLNKEIQFPSILSDDGGEGVIYRIQGMDDKIAKIFGDIELRRTKEQKVAFMRMFYQEGQIKNNLIKKLAWPEEIIVDERGKFCGFIMKHIEGDRFENLYDPGNTYSMQQKLTVLINLCSLVEELHNCGIVIGDFNPYNIVVGHNLEVYLLDIDSTFFHYKNNYFPCIRCYPGFVPPEIIRSCNGLSYESAFRRNRISFTTYGDYFDLAVHIFATLMNGIHPFEDFSIDGNDEIQEIDDRVVEGESVFFHNTLSKPIPIRAPEFNSFPAYIIDMFKRAFVSGFQNPSTRPTAGEWSQALRMYQQSLTVCANNPVHAFNRASTSNHCPYCEAEKRLALKLQKYNIQYSHGGQTAPTDLSKKKQ